MSYNQHVRGRSVRSPGTCMAAIVVTALSLAGCQGGTAPARPAGGPSVLSGSAPSAPAINPDIHKIKHVVMIMQENRSFDSYFGTYPGAVGIPMAQGKPTVCVPDPANGGCVRSYPDHADVNGGGPHGAAQAQADIDFGKMDGFVEQSEMAQRNCADQTDP